MKLRKEEKERSKEKEEKKPPTPPIGLAHFSVDNSVDKSGWLVAPPARADGGRTPSLPVKSSVFHVAGRKMGMTDADVDAWIRYQKDTGWTYTSGRPITASNFHRSLRMWREINKVIEERNAAKAERQALRRSNREKWAAMREEAEEKRRAKAAIMREKIAATEKGWELCREECANCNGVGCACGIKIPPAHQSWPKPPRECPGFKAREA